jgi:hypothetical protein
VKRIVIALCLCIGLWLGVKAEDITMSDTLWLRKATHVNYDVGAWDTVFVDIMRGAVQVQRIGLTSNGKGRWGGFYVPSYRGNFVAEYNAVYSSDTTVEEEYFTVLDTVAFQGAAAGLTAAEILDSMLTRGYAEGGSGLYACTLSVRDSSLTAGIPGVKVNIRNSAQTATVRWGTTDANGLAMFGIDTLAIGSTYKVWLQQIGYNFTFPETLDLRNDTTATYYGTAFSIASPPPDSTCAVIGQVWNPMLDSLSGVIVTFTLVAPEDSVIVYNHGIFSHYEVSDTTTVTGRFQLNLLPEAVFDRPYGMLYYKAKITYPVSWGGLIVEYDSVSVPIATQVEADSILH